MKTHTANFFGVDTFTLALSAKAQNFQLTKIMDEIKTLAEARTKIAELEGKLETANKDTGKVTELQTKIETLTEQSKTLKSERDEAHKKLGAAETQRDDFKAKAGSAETRAEKAETDLTAAKAEVSTLKGEAQTTEKAAAKIAAGSGIETPAPATPTGEDTGDSGDLMAEYDSLNSPQERDAFRRKHGAELRKLISKR